MGRVAQTTLATRDPSPVPPPQAAARRRDASRATLARTLVEGAYVILFAVLLVRLIVLIRTPVPVPEPAAVQPSGGASVPLSVLTAQNPFGGEMDDDAPPAEYADAAETTLDLTLAGLNIGPDLTTAIIQTPDGRQRTYALDQEILPGVVFRDARPNQAIISRDGLTETLTLREAKEGAAPPRRRPLGQARGQDLPASAAVLTPAQALAAVSEAVSIRQQEDGALALHPGGASDAFTRAGFAPGDVIVAVDGTPAPGDAERVLEMIADMPPGRPVTITVERSGLPLDVPLDLRAMTQ